MDAQQEKKKKKKKTRLTPFSKLAERRKKKEKKGNNTTIVQQARRCVACPGEKKKGTFAAGKEGEEEELISRFGPRKRSHEQWEKEGKKSLPKSFVQGGRKGNRGRMVLIDTQGAWVQGVSHGIKTREKK